MGRLQKSKRVYTETMQLDLSSIEPSLAGPKRPQDKILLSNVSDTFIKSLKEFGQKHIDNPIHVKMKNFKLTMGMSLLQLLQVVPILLILV